MKVNRKIYEMGFKKPLDFKAIRACVLDCLTDKGPQTSQQLCNALAGAYSEDAIYRALRYLKEDKVVSRESPSKPWTINVKS